MGLMLCLGRKCKLWAVVPEYHSVGLSVKMAGFHLRMTSSCPSTKFIFEPILWSVSWTYHISCYALMIGGQLLLGQFAPGKFSPRTISYWIFSGQRSSRRSNIYCYELCRMGEGVVPVTTLSVTRQLYPSPLDISPGIIHILHIALNQ